VDTETITEIQRFLLSPALLVSGTNVLAIELHQREAHLFEDAYVSASVSLNSLANAGDAVVLPVAATWAYNYQPRPDGGESMARSNWFDPSYDASSWPTGPAPLGFNIKSANTRLPSDLWVTSAFFRASFNVRCDGLCVVAERAVAVTLLFAVHCLLLCAAGEPLASCRVRAAARG
jgi:hypothetical protein